MNQSPASMSEVEIADTTVVPRARRWVGIAVVALSVATLSSCGSDGDSSEDAFCDAGDSLRANITGIADIDVLSGGLDAVTNQLAAIRSDVDQLRESGSDVAAEEISTLETAVDDLRSAVDDLGSDISVSGAQAVATSIASVVTAAGGVYEQLDAACS